MKRLLFILGMLAGVSAVHAQTDSIGVYSVTPEGVKRVEVLKYAQTKISGALLSSKAKLKFNGATSPNHFAGTATFRLYYGVPSPYDAAKYFMFTPAYSVQDVSVIRFDVKKDSRLFTTVSVSVLGGSVGAKAAKDIKVDTRQIRDNVYEVTVIGPAGEYCLAPSINGTAGYAGVFDFTLE